MQNETMHVVPQVKKSRGTVGTTKNLEKQYTKIMLSLLLSFFLLLILVAYLPLNNIIKTISLLLGGFILSDIHHSIKAYVHSANN